MPLSLLPRLLLIIAAVCAGAAEADKKKKSKKRQQPRHTESTGHDEDPPKPKFKIVTELTAETFVRDVRDMINGSFGPGESPPYYPLVMFHMSWCKHCRHALPEFEEAAGVVKQYEKNLQGQVPPKFFLLECDATKEATAVCNRYSSASFPVIKLFRPGRALLFNRPRISQTFSWWAMHSSRAVVRELGEEAHWNSIPSHTTVFALTASTADKTLLEVWQSLAFDFIEEYYFLMVPSTSPFGRTAPSVPHVTVRGPRLEPRLHDGLYDRESLYAWINTNRFPIVSEVDERSGFDLMSSELPVVTFVHRHNSSAADPLRRFAEAARDLGRATNRFVFATANITTQEQYRFMARWFPLMTENHIFVFRSRHFYWEDPALQDASQLSIETLEALLANSEALHDGSVGSWAKAQRKYIYRYASSSIAGFLIVFHSALACMGCCWICVRDLFRSDEAVAKKKEAKKSD
eukprot:NODE_7399_length_1582_cov_6.797251.p1 GENE.NODE_7399_length_1582_cov_6.797251~~NODE_7399_length_1582_cov_6.797251.p1  ORF type:complete len:463 (-),score=102.20 NODE_7399_length_1582_cov_6.797251:76-1464(-)